MIMVGVIISVRYSISNTIFVNFVTLHSYPLLISTGFLKYPLELKKKSVRTEKKFQL